MRPRFQRYVALSIGLHGGAAVLFGALAPERASLEVPPPLIVSLVAAPGPPAPAPGPAPAPAPAAPAPAPEPIKRSPPKPVAAPRALPRAPQRSAPPREIARVEPATALASELPAVSSAPPSAGASPTPGGAPGGLPGGSPLASAGTGGDPIAAYLALVRTRVQAERRYSPMARRRGLEGIVTLTVQIDASGAVERLDVDDSAPLLLARAAEQAVERAGPFPPPPAGLGAFRIPVRYRLND